MRSATTIPARLACIDALIGDNGLGKSFLLDLSWWALTRTWASTPALPPDPKLWVSIKYAVRGVDGTVSLVIAHYNKASQIWAPKPGLLPIPGIVVYVRVDGSVSVWDPARNHWRSDPARQASYHFRASEVWEGLDLASSPNANPKRVCEGLERDGVSWQENRKPQFHALGAILEKLSPPGEPIRIRPPRRVFLGEGPWR